MPSVPLIRKLVKSDRRNEWKALKTKHHQALAAKRVDFDAGLGKALDKYQPPVKAVTKLFVDEKLSKPALQKVLAAARPLESVAVHYLDQVKGLGGPAEKEMTAFLKAIVADCAAWEQVLDIFESTGFNVGPVQLAAVKGLYGPLDRLTAQLDNLGKSLPAAQTELKAMSTRATKPAIKPVKLSGAQWKQLQDLPEPDWRKLLRAKVGAIAAGVESLIPKRTAVLHDVAPLLIAVQRFDARSDYETFKERAQTVAATSLAAFHQQAQSLEQLLADPEIANLLGFDKGLPSIQTGRAGVSVNHARQYAEQLTQAIRGLR